MQDSRDILEETLTKIVEDIRDRLVETGTNASGRTSRDIRIEMYDGGGKITGRRAFHTVETGRPPGPVPQNFTAIVRQWMNDKGITAPSIPYKRIPSENWQPKYTEEERGAIAMASAIAHKIKVSGTSLFREGGRKDIYTDVIERRVTELEKKLPITIINRL